MVSFAKKVKKELSCLEEKIKNCCGYSLIYGILFSSEIYQDEVMLKMLNEDVGNFFVGLCKQISVKSDLNYKYEKKKISISKGFLRYNHIEEIKKSILRCGRCKEHFLKGLFLANGTVCDPEKSYRLELVFDSCKKAEEVNQFLGEMGISALYASRSGKNVLYLRKSEAIEDFFANIGATSLAFDIMNSKINKELINNANRVTNCDAANINKSIKASNKYNFVISEMIQSGKISCLPSHLQEMAYKRSENKELSFTELGKLFSPPISKSGVYHRLEKIVDFYEEIENN